MKNTVNLLTLHYSLLSSRGREENEARKSQAGRIAKPVIQTLTKASEDYLINEKRAVKLSFLFCFIAEVILMTHGRKGGDSTSSDAENKPGLDHLTMKDEYDFNKTEMAQAWLKNRLKKGKSHD